MKVIGCGGAFDYEIHKGHLIFLAKAAKHATKLVVFLQSDEVIIYSKQRKPYFSQVEREGNLLACLVSIDEVVYLCDNEEKNESIILKYGLDAYMFGYDQKRPFDKRLERQLIEKEIEVFRCGTSHTKHTTELLLRDGLLKELRI